jgi:hypothetical protein
VKKGDRVIVAGEVGAAHGVIVLCSGNEDSIIVELDSTDATLATASGTYWRFLPLLRVDGVYRDLIRGEVISVTLIARH